MSNLEQEGQGGGATEEGGMAGGTEDEGGMGGGSEGDMGGGTDDAAGRRPRRLLSTRRLR
jgi:hypothetical protein